MLVTVNAQQHAPIDNCKLVILWFFTSTVVDLLEAQSTLSEIGNWQIPFSTIIIFLIFIFLGSRNIYIFITTKPKFEIYNILCKDNTILLDGKHCLPHISALKLLFWTFTILLSLKRFIICVYLSDIVYGLYFQMGLCS